jgi:hypothetical protein
MSQTIEEIESSWIQTDKGFDHAQYSKKVADNHFNIIEIMETQRVYFLEKNTEEYDLNPDDKLYILEFHEIKGDMFENKNEYEEELSAYDYEPVDSLKIKSKSTDDYFSKKDSDQLLAEIISETHDPKYYETFRTKKELRAYLKSIYNIIDY